MPFAFSVMCSGFIALSLFRFARPAPQGNNPCPGGGVGPVFSARAMRPGPFTGKARSFKRESAGLSAGKGRAFQPGKDRPFSWERTGLSAGKGRPFSLRRQAQSLARGAGWPGSSAAARIQSAGARTTPVHHMGRCAGPAAAGRVCQVRCCIRCVAGRVASRLQAGSSGKRRAAAVGSQSGTLWVPGGRCHTTYGRGTELAAGIGIEPGRGSFGRGLREPGVLDYFSQFLQGELADPVPSQQHRRMAIKV